jgi:hypothetical protein
MGGARARGRKMFSLIRLALVLGVFFPTVSSAATRKAASPAGFKETQKTTLGCGPSGCLTDAASKGYQPGKCLYVGSRD